MSSDRQYWDLKIKNQSARRVALVNTALARFGAIIHDRHEEKYFNGKQQWRNPLTLRISLPKGKKYDFILATKLSCWLHEPARIGITEEIFNKPKIKLKGNHDQTNLSVVRRYRLHPIDQAYIKDFQSGKVINGIENVNRVLNGDLDLVLKK